LELFGVVGILCHSITVKENYLGEQKKDGARPRRLMLLLNVGAPLRGLAAVAFSNVWKSAFDTLPKIGNPLGMGLIPPLVAAGFVDFHPGHVSSAGSRHFKHGPLRTPGKSSRPRCKAGVGTICFSGGKSLPGALLVLAPGTVRVGAGWPALGSLHTAFMP
jgi:hypothetical protein